ncbi:MAG: hypothetical protein ABW171_13475 [Steroidobacter sp.]
MGLLITDTAASPVRVTFDVDLVASVSALAAYHGMEKELARLGFKRDLSSDAPICRWRYRELEVDLMPTDPNILGFSNRWYPLASRDLEDIINVVDGRSVLLEEIAGSPAELRAYLRERCSQLLAEPNFGDYLPGLIAPGEDLAARAQIVAEKLQVIAHVRA